MTKQFTGRHMAMIMVAFFSVVIAVNVVMARDAIKTFGGTVVENSYVASQQYNGWLRDAATQDHLGWRARASAEAGNRIVVALAGPRGQIEHARVTIDAEHPVGLLKDQQLVLSEQRPGIYAATHSLPPGRWRLRIDAQAPTGEARFVQDLRL